MGILKGADIKTIPGFEFGLREQSSPKNYHRKFQSSFVFMRHENGKKHGKK